VYSPAVKRPPVESSLHAETDNAPAAIHPRSERRRDPIGQAIRVSYRRRRRHRERADRTWDERITTSPLQGRSKQLTCADTRREIP
jgi:hypothetical protein